MLKELGLLFSGVASVLTGCTSLPPTITPSAGEQPQPLYGPETGSRDFYTWTSPGGTKFQFDAEFFPGTFYPDRIDQVLGPHCTRPLVVSTVRVLIGPNLGFDPETHEASDTGYDGITVSAIDQATGKVADIKVGIAGGAFETARKRGPYLFTSPHLPGVSVRTNALDDLNGTLFEETAYHACGHTVGTPLDPPNAQPESAKWHFDFLRNPTVMFKPDGW